MNIGILSDTHGNMPRTLAALAALLPFKPAHIIHCGDIGSDRVIDALVAECAATETPVTCVLGNVDWEGECQTPAPHVKISGRFAQLELGGKKIAVIHGDDRRRLEAIIESQKFDFVFTGHTHQRADETTGRTRVINPGALHRTAEPGFAVLNLSSGTLQFLDV